jgi:hypothetical protein
MIHFLKVAKHIQYVRKGARWKERTRARDAHTHLRPHVGTLRQQRSKHLQMAISTGGEERCPSIPLLRDRRALVSAPPSAHKYTILHARTPACTLSHVVSASLRARIDTSTHERMQSNLSNNYTDTSAHTHKRTSTLYLSLSVPLHTHAQIPMPLTAHAPQTTRMDMSPAHEMLQLACIPEYHGEQKSRAAMIYSPVYSLALAN